MTRYVGIAPFKQLHELKRYLLMFDEVSIIRSPTEKLSDPAQKADILWLEEKGIVHMGGTLVRLHIEEPSPGSDSFRFSFQVESPLNSGLMGQYENAAAALKKLDKTLHGNRASEFVAGLYEGMCRRLAEQLNIEDVTVRAVSLAQIENVDAQNSLQDLQSSPGEILKVIVRKMPTPSDETSLEQILNFRSDETSKIKITAFRHWLQKMLAQRTPAREVVEELEYLQQQYSEHMKLHEMKVNTGAFETVVTILAETAENLVKFNWGKAGRVPFVLKHRQIDLLEAESKAPGREISYVAHTANHFGR
jgi:hypothetical protein